MSFHYDCTLILQQVLQRSNGWKKGKFGGVITDYHAKLFAQAKIVICSFQFASRHAEELMVSHWYLSVIDDDAFGDAKSFRAQYASLTGKSQFNHLKSRLAPVCHRTLRRPLLQALPSGQRTLMTLLMRKLLASSTFAITGALDSLARKLEWRIKDVTSLRENLEEDQEELDVIVDDYDCFSKEAEEWMDDEEEPELLREDDIEVIEREIEDLRGFRDLAIVITENAKGQALLGALKDGMDKARELGGAEKVRIFTGSRRTHE